MSLNPTRARESGTVISCRLDNVVTLQKDGDTTDFVIWQSNTKCCGPKGIFPSWTREPSTCPGLKECVLLQAAELFYPPDASTWALVEKTDDWEQIKPSFVLQEDCGCMLPDDIVLHIKEMQRRWGVGIDA